MVSGQAPAPAPTSAPVAAPVVLDEKARLAEIWDQVDTRFARQIDFWFDDGEFPKAIQGLFIQYAYAPNDYEVVTNLGFLLESSARADEALDAYNLFIKNNPKDPDAPFPAGNLYFKKKDYAKTVQVLAPSLGKGKPHPNSYRIVARAYEKMGNYKKAIETWEKQLKAFPDDLPAQANIRRVKAKIGLGK